MKGLTEKQEAILAFIEAFSNEKGYPPSYREIMRHFSLASPGSVYKYVQILKKKKMLLLEKGCVPLKNASSFEEDVKSVSAHTSVELSFIGFIEDGSSIETLPQSQSIAVPKYLVPHPNYTYVFRVRGDFLNEEYLEDGDLLLVEARTEAEAGETVLVLVNKQSLMILQYYPEAQGMVSLKGKNRDHHPLMLRRDDIQIKGVLVGLIRAYV